MSEISLDLTFEGHECVVKLLIEHGADAEISGFVGKPIDIAERHGNSSLRI